MRSRSMRRAFLVIFAALLTVSAATACSADQAPPASPDGGGGAGAFPVTIEHKHGSTEIPMKPQRVVCAGRTDHDVLLALGIVPASVYQFVPSMNRGVGVWAEPRLGAADPVILTNPLNFEKIAALSPDLILNVQSMGEDTDYRTLSRIAPTVSLPPDTAPNTVSWQDSTRIISTAVGCAADGVKLVADTEATLNNAAADNPSFTGKTVSILLGYGGKLGGYTTADTRMRVATALGLTPSSYTVGLDQRKFFVELSDELVNNADADVVILLTLENLSAAGALEQYPAILRSTFAAENRLVIVEDPKVSLALSLASVLSIPYAVDGLVPLLAAKLG